jgi:hypothetical protein
MIPTQKKVQMPDNLSMKDLDRISYVFSKMSVASKHDFLAALMVDCPNQYAIVIEALGNDYRKAIVQA